MKQDDLLKYINNSLATQGLTLSEQGKTEVIKRYSKSEQDGGYSQYWKEASLKEAEGKRILNEIKKEV